ncbi:MAG: transcriptional regulator, MarR family [Clostridiales bacterium]|jgi:DNA-binding MarR family transcriptional regulator|nr:transcriptional regulator, MarR family [Clostridiales bacterium]
MNPMIEKMSENTNTKRKFIFGAIFLYATKLQTLGDRFDEMVSMKQWLLMVMAGQFENHKPTLTELGKIMGCSRQNVKKIAVPLERKGFLELIKDEKDARTLCVSLTEKCYEYFKKREKLEDKFLDILYENTNENEIDNFFNSMVKMNSGIEAVETALDKNYIK